MTIYNVIEKSESEVFVYTFSSYQNAKEYLDKCKKHLLWMYDCKSFDELKKHNDLGEDSFIVDEDHIDIYKLEYELYIEEQELDKWYVFDDM